MGEYIASGKYIEWSVAVLMFRLALLYIGLILYAFLKMTFPALEDSTLLAIAVYAGMAGLYLVVLPGALLFYLKARWNVMSSIERLAAYAALFVVFPGALLLSPFLNFRPKRREA